MINSENSGRSAANQKEKEPLKIILAEDDKDDQDIFMEAVNATNVPSDVTTVENGQELIDILKDRTEPKPDIVFIDINMPVKGGKEALAEIKSDQELKDIPAVMLSTSNHQKDIEDTFNSGANLYIQKPNSFASLILILKKVFMLHWTKTLLDPVKKVFFVSDRNISHED